MTVTAAAFAHRLRRAPRSPSQTATALTLATLLALSATGPASAAEVEWLFRGSGFWDDGANWLEGTPPGPQDDVLVNLGSGNQPAIIRQRPGDTGRSVYAVRSLTTQWPVQLLGGNLVASGDLNFGAGLDWRDGFIGVMQGVAPPTGDASFAQGFQATPTTALLGLTVRRATLSGASVIDTRGAAADATAGLRATVTQGFVLTKGASLTLLGDMPQLTVLGSVDLRGDLIRDGGSGVAALWLDSGSALGGTVRVNTGTLDLRYIGSGAVHHDGHFTVAAGSTLRITPDQTFTGTLDGPGTVKFSLAGVTQLRSAGVQMQQGTMDLDAGTRLVFSGVGDATVGTLRTAGGELLPDDRLTVLQRMQASTLLNIRGTAGSVTTFAQGAELADNLNVYSGTLVLGGGATRLSGTQALGIVIGSTLRVAPGSLLQLDAGHTANTVQGPVLGGGLLDVQGTLARSAAASGPGLVQTQIVNSGLVDLAGGQLTVQLAYTQTETGTLRLRLTGNDDPRLVLQGAASFAGTLALNLADGFSLHAGERVALLRWAEHSGSLTLDADSAGLAPGLHLALEADAQALWLTASAVTGGGSGGISAPPAVPEPGTWALWLAGLGAVAARRPWRLA